MSAAKSIKIVSLYRYPLKGLSPEALTAVELRPGETIPGDRVYAIENGFSRFDPDNPRHLPKINFIMRMRNERLAALDTRFDHATDTLTIYRGGKQVARGVLNTKLGRQIIEQFFAGYMGGELKGPPRVVFASGHSFSDVSAKCLHFVNLATVQEVAEAVGKTLDPLRFRANVYFDGPFAWEERKWIGRTLKLGTARLRVFKETERCDATNVNPETAERDTAIPPTLLRTYGHPFVGFYAEVIEAGEAHPGDEIVLD